MAGCGGGPAGRHERRIKGLGSVVSSLFQLTCIPTDTTTQGTSYLLSSSQLVAVDGPIKREKDWCVLWCVCVDLDRRGGGYDADKASGGQHVNVLKGVMTLNLSDLFHSSFFQSICIIGYTLFPLVIAAMLSAVRLPTMARIPVYIVLIAWSLAAGISILGGSGVVKNRVGIAVYPLFVFYVGLGCLCFIS